MKNNIEILNKKASFDYEFLETLEVGLVLKGNEVKSIRKGSANLKNSFCKVIKNEIFVFDFFISQYNYSHIFVRDENFPKKLLMKKKEILKWEQKVKEKGLSIIPIKIYFVNNRCKLQIALAKGKKNYDKRDSLKQKTISMDTKRELKNY